MTKPIRVSIVQRMKAAKVVKAYRDQNHLRDAVVHFGIPNPRYLPMIENMLKRSNGELKYFAPGWAILKVLEKSDE